MFLFSFSNKLHLFVKELVSFWIMMMKYLPEEKHKGVWKSSEVVMSTDLCIRIEFDVTKYLFMTMIVSDCKLTPVDLMLI